MQERVPRTCCRHLPMVWWSSEKGEREWTTCKYREFRTTAKLSHFQSDLDREGCGRNSGAVNGIKVG